MFLSVYVVFGVIIFVLLATFPVFELKKGEIVIYSSKENGIWYKDIILSVVCGTLWLPLLIGALILKDKEN